MLISKINFFIIPLKMKTYHFSFQGPVSQFVFVNISKVWDDARVFCEQTGNKQLVKHCSLKGCYHEIFELCS